MDNPGRGRKEWNVWKAGLRRQTRTGGVPPVAPARNNALGGKQVRPPQKPNPEKWKKEGGTVTEHGDGTVTYSYTHPTRGTISVRYNKDGYAQFKEAGLVKKEVEIEMKPDWTTDFKKADAALLEKHKINRNVDMETWHHSEDGKTMQLIGKDIHRKFHHTGGHGVASNRGGST